VYVLADVLTLGKVAGDSSPLIIPVGTDDLAGWRKRLAEHKIAVREEDHGPQHSLFIRRPDYAVWEITSPASRAACSEVAEEAHAVVERWLAGQ
jgi:hypothetical protein